MSWMTGKICLTTMKVWPPFMPRFVGEEVEQPPTESEPAAPQEPSDESDSEYDSSEPDSYALSFLFIV